MGKAVKALSSPLGIVANPMVGLNALGGKKALGALGINLDSQEAPYIDPAHQQADLYKAFANDYQNQMGLADKGVQESALTKDLYGTGGLQSQLANENKQLAGQGFKLNTDDMTAYGQTSGDISRLFGQQEQDVTKSLARRGLGAASSGAAGAAFSGLAGNKNEMLAKAQTDIAQRRYQDTMSRLGQVRNQMQSLGMQGSQLAQQRYDTKKGSLLDAYNVERGVDAAQANARAEQAANRKPGLFETIGTGLQAGIGNMATQAPGIGLGAATGGKFGTMNNYQQMQMGRKT